MRYINCLQGTETWLQARAGAITASRFADAISVLKVKSGDKKPGDPTGAADKYAGDVAIERISGKPYGEPPNAWTLKRGHELEAMARPAYELSTGHIAEEAGIVKTDCGEFGYSTDGLVNPFYDGDQIIGCEGLIEIKCPVDSVKIRAMLETGDLSEYMHQMQGGMWITGARWCDFIQYVPDLETVGNDLFVKRVMRDEAFIEAMSAGLMIFRQRVADFKHLYSKKAAADVAEVIDQAEKKAQDAIESAQAAPVPAQAPAQPVPLTVTVRQVVQPLFKSSTKPTTPPTLKLGDINAHLSPITLTVDGLTKLGFPPAATDKNAKLYHGHDLTNICAALHELLDRVQAKRAA